MPRKVYTPEFKQTAVRLASAPGTAVERVAHELGITSWTLRRWMKEQLGTSSKRSPQIQPEVAPGSEQDLRAQLRRLEVENKRLRMERDILKKATAFFAAEDQRAGAKEEP